MTEADWLTCDDPREMLEFLRGRAGERKLRLFAVACCRRVWEFIPRGLAERAVEEAERFADGAVSPGERKELLRSLIDEAGPDLLVALGDGTERLRSFPDEMACGGELAAWALDVRWQFPGLVASGAAALRAGVETAAELRWGDLPLLADALLDAGCEDEALMEHCRGGSEHARGCYAVDVILGRD